MSSRSDYEGRGRKSQLRASYVEIFDLEDRAQAVTRFEQVAAERQPAGA